MIPIYIGKFGCRVKTGNALADVALGWVKISHKMFALILIYIYIVK